MLKWLDKNKEWFFQGAGIAILSAATGVAGYLWNEFTKTANPTEALTLAILMLIFISILGIFLILLYQAFQTHLNQKTVTERINSLDSNLLERMGSMEKIIRSLEAPRRFEDWYKVQPEIQRLIHNSFENNESTKIHCLGVALHVSWKTVRECVEQYQKIHGKFPKTTIHLKVISPQWKFWNTLGNAWHRRNEALHDSVTDFLQIIRGNPDVQVILCDYEYLPNWHGVLINERHLFRSSCLYRNNEFTVHKNPYVYFCHEENYYSDMQISEFQYWFNHEARPRTLIDLLNRLTVRDV